MGFSNIACPEGTEVFEIFLGKELALHATIFCDKYPAFTLHYTNITLLWPAFLWCCNCLYNVNLLIKGKKYMYWLNYFLFSLASVGLPVNKILGFDHRRSTRTKCIYWHTYWTIIKGRPSTEEGIAHVLCLTFLYGVK